MPKKPTAKKTGFKASIFDLDETLISLRPKAITKILVALPKIIKYRTKQAVQKKNRRKNKKIKFLDIFQAITLIISDVSTFRRSKKQAIQVLKKIKKQVPICITNTVRGINQKKMTIRQLKEEGLQKIINTMRFRKPGILTTSSKRKVVQDTLENLNKKGMPDAKIVIFDDSYRMAVTQAEVDPERVLVYHIPDREEQLLIRLEKKLGRKFKYPKNVIPMDNIKKAYKDFQQRQ